MPENNSLGANSGSREPDPSFTGSGPAGFDPGRGACAACRARGKTWSGSDPTCSFPNGGEFSSVGWNCATAGLIRDMCPRWETPESERVSGPYWNEDQYWAAINLTGIELEPKPALTLWLSWYKGRGRTEAMWLLDEYGAPWPPNEDDVVRIAAAIAMETRRAETTGSVARP